MHREPKPIFPFRDGEWYTVRDLREAGAEILARTASDEEFAAAMRVQIPSSNGIHTPIRLTQTHIIFR